MKRAMATRLRYIPIGFDDFAKSQWKFVQTVAELSAKPAYAESLHEMCAVETVMPLVANTIPTVRMNVVLCLARLANNSEQCAKQILCLKNQLQRLLGQIGGENKYYKKNAMSLIKNINKHAPSSILIKECGGVDAIAICLKDFDVNVRESALLAISAIARHDASVSTIVVESGLLSSIVQCLKEQQSNLKLYALSALTEIAKHNQDLAQTVVEVKCLATVINFLLPSFADIKVQKSALILIKNIVKHSLFLTESAIESNLFPNIILLMKRSDESIRNNAAKVVREIVKQSVQIAQMVVNTGGIAGLLNVIRCTEEFPYTPAVLALGFIAALSPELALAIIQSKALIHLTSILKDHNTDGYIKTAVVWTLGMIGQHSHEHATYISDCGAITIMMDVYMDSSLENESKIQCSTALQQLLNECDDYTILEQLLMVSKAYDDEITTFILDKISKILPKNTKARRNFITNGHLKIIQSLKPDVDSELFRVIEAVNCSFPDDIIQMVAGDFPETVMNTVDMYVPKIQCLFHNDEIQVRKSHSSMKPPLSGEGSTLMFE